MKSRTKWDWTLNVLLRWLEIRDIGKVKCGFGIGGGGKCCFNGKIILYINFQ